MYTTFGAPSGARGGSNGDQSGTESLISTLTVPLNCSLTFAAPSARRRVTGPALDVPPGKSRLSAIHTARPRPPEVLPDGTCAARPGTRRADNAVVISTDSPPNHLTAARSAVHHPPRVSTPNNLPPRALFTARQAQRRSLQSAGVPPGRR